MSLFPNTGGATVSAPLAAVTLASHAESGNDPGSSFTFSSQALGAAAADRKLVVITGAGSSGATISAMTIAGVSAELVLAKHTAESHSEMWQADVPTGTSGDIVITYSTTIHNTGIGIFRITGAGTGPTSPSDTANDSQAAPIALTITVPANGVCIAGACDDATSSHTWAELTEVYDASASGGSRMHTGALLASETLQTDLAVTCTFSNTVSQETGLAASWTPA